MRAYLIRRLLLAIPTLLGITAVTFLIIQLAPGDPAAMARSIEMVLNVPDLGKAMGLRGRGWVAANFEISKCTERYEQLYQQVMGA